MRFLASLSNGKTVIEDTRSNEPHAWKRLKKFLKANPEISITGLRIQRNAKEIPMPANQKGYFYGKKHSAVFSSSIQQGFVGIGYYDGVVVSIRWMQLPKLNRGTVENRNLEEAGPTLIQNPNA
jgi:hypothetical protein